MSNYTQTTLFTPKDSLPDNDPEKVVLGADFDGEFTALVASSATKLDTAGAGIGVTSTTVALNYTSLTDVAPATGDKLAFEDTSNSDAIVRATVDTIATLYAGTVTATGLSATAAVLSVDIANLTAEATADVTNDFLVVYDDSASALRKMSIVNAIGAGTVASTTTLTAGGGLTGGGDLTTNRQFDVGAGTGITINANDVSLQTAHVRNVDHSFVSMTAGNGITGGGTLESTRTFDLDISGLSAIDIDGVVATDGILVDNGGTMERMAMQDMGTPVAAASTQTLALDDANTVIHNTSASDYTVTVPPNSTVAFPIGAEIGFSNGSTGKQTLAEGAGVTITSLSSDKVVRASGGAGVIRKVATNTWMLAGTLEA